MFGNLTGWLISAGVALAMGWLLWTVAVPPARTEPTNKAVLAVAKEAIVLPVPWSAAISPGTKDCNAGDMYQKAIDDYLAAPYSYEKFHDAPLKMKESDLTAIADIVEARDCKNFALFSKNPSKIVNYENNEPPLEALGDAGDICCTFGLLYTNPSYPTADPKRAVQLWEAAFILGAHLYDERLTSGELVKGHSLMQEAAGALRDYYKTQKNQDQVEKLEKFIDPENEYQLKITAALTIIGGIQEAPADNYSGVGIYAGDIYQIAQSSTADPMFRTEAIKHIGHYRYNVVNRGDELGARKVLRVLAENPSLPGNVKVAAQAARDLTIEQHHKFGGG